MDVLVLGGSGMLGHKVFQEALTQGCDAACTVRGRLADTPLRSVTLFPSGRIHEGVDAADRAGVRRLLAALRPRVIVNCIGVIKQRPEGRQAIPCITVNALFPHQLAEWAQEWGGRLIHISTDCVFSGRKGRYTEDDVADPEDLYGRSKTLGEVLSPNALTIRTSLIGRELHHFASLLEWFMAQRGNRVRGYTRALFSGVTTNYLARTLLALIDGHVTMAGLYHLAGETISKFDLLSLINSAMDLRIEIEPEDGFCCDRSLAGDRFRAATGFGVPSWEVLIDQLTGDPTPYNSWRSARC